MTRTRPLLAAFFITMAGCSEAPKKTDVEKPIEPVTGSHALFQMYTGARAWAQDLRVLRMTSINLAAVKPQPGRAGAWQVTFVSPSLGQSRTYTYSVIEASTTLRKGIFSENPRSWGGPSGSEKPFLIDAVKVDSDDAYKTALTKAAAFESKHPGMIMSYLLELNDRFPDAVWRVIWGESAGASGFSVFVDASTGEYLEKLT
ncbi:MAG: hypothetical protein M3Y07_09170 [Acidobacteriota bacterium]|nr:hypothetical protein [Acidobacteriota bacterium]